jgi:hypothetical protein
MEPDLQKYACPLNTEEQREFFDQMWQRHFDNLMPLLLRHGKKWDTFEGDFLLVDTAYQCRLQKVEVMNVSFITPELIRDIQRCLCDLNSNWGVMISLWLDNPEFRVNARGMIVCRDHIEEHWDWHALKARYGDRLKWPQAICDPE